MLDSILFKNVTIVSGADSKVGDVLVQGGKIAAVGPSLAEHAQKVIKESGLMLMPGVIDPHVHFRDPGFPHKETIASGSRAAASGGVTSFFDMPNTNPSTTTRDRLAQKKQIAADTSLVNYNFFIGASTDNLDELIRAENVPGIKIYVGSSTGNLLVNDAKLLKEIFTQTPHLIAVHSEDEDIIQANKAKYADSTDVMTHLKVRSSEAAIKCTRFLSELAMATRHRLHICHLTTVDEADYLYSLPSDAPITWEVCIQHLLLHAPDIYEKIGTFAQINPPIREKHHADGLWRHLKAGHIHCVATDHAPHTIEEKLQPYPKAPSGMPGVETLLPLLLTLAHQGKCTYNDIVKWACEGPADVFNIEQKGMIAPGYDADLVLVDPKAKRQIQNGRQYTKANWSAFDQMMVHGVPIATFVHGQQVFREGDFFDAIKGQEIRIRPPQKR